MRRVEFQTNKFKRFLINIHPIGAAGVVRSGDAKRKKHVLQRT